METLKKLIDSRFKTLSFLFSILTFSCILLMVRIKLNKSFFYIFLIWNIFLAIIPYTITLYLSTIKLNKIKLLIGLLLWLLFLPNAPYIVTDFLHLKVSNSIYMWLDILVILSFALSGLFLFYQSLLDMQKQMAIHFKKIPKSLFVLSIIFLSSLGVYLGRFLRYNSWDIINHTDLLINDLWNIVLYPIQHMEVWLFVFGYSSFLLLGFWMFKSGGNISSQN